MEFRRFPTTRTRDIVSRRVRSIPIHPRDVLSNVTRLSFVRGIKRNKFVIDLVDEGTTASRNQPGVPNLEQCYHWKKREKRYRFSVFERDSSSRRMLRRVQESLVQSIPCIPFEQRARVCECVCEIRMCACVHGCVDRSKEKKKKRRSIRLLFQG